jgi:hypothetical protein
MEYSLFLGKIWAIVFIVAGIALLANHKRARSIIGAWADDGLYLVMLGSGFILTFIGSLLVLTHNVWTGGALPVIITIVGWLVLLKGILRAWFPSWTVRMTKRVLASNAILIAPIIVLIVGIYLAFASFK